MTKKRKATLSTDQDGAIVYCWFCERTFDDKMVLNAHQKAKHFTCARCSRKLSSVPGLVNHVKTMHGETLTNVANAIKGRDDPETVPDVQGMDGIPAADLAEFTARMTGQPPAISSVGIRAPRPWNAPPITQSSQQPATKRAKIDAPLDSQTIAAQLAEFQAKKEQEELAQFIATGVAYPPGTRSQSAFFIIRSNPPGQGAWTAKGWSQLYPGSELPKPSPPRPWPRDADGKSAHSSSINSSAQLSTPANESLSSPKISAAKPAPPPSLRFTKTDVILSLSPPTPGPLAPGQEPSAKQQSLPGQIVGADVGAAPWQNAGGGRGMVRGGRPPGTIAARGIGRGGGFGTMGRGTGNMYQVYPPQPMNISRPMMGRGVAVPGAFPGAVPGQQQPFTQPPPGMRQQYQQQQYSNPYQQQRPGQYPYQQAPFPPPPPQNQPYQYPQYQAPQAYPTQGYPTHQPPYPQRQLSPTGYSAPPMTAGQPHIPFEQLYPMHGKRASDFVVPPSQSAVQAVPLASPTDAIPLPGGGGATTLMIITDDTVSPEEKLAARYGYGKP